MAICVLVLGAAGIDEVKPISDPPSDEVVGILNGKAYKFGDLVPLFCTPYNPLACTPSRLRLGAVLEFRKLVLNETLGPSMLDCDLSSSDSEIMEFAGWWKKEVELGEKGYPLRKPRASEITPRNFRVTEIAREEIRRWKEKVCLYRVYRGGHVQNPVPPVVDIRGDLPFPSVHPGIPHDAYLAHFKKLMMAGKLRFTDQGYENEFFWPDRDIHYFRYYAPSEETDAVLIPYWKRNSSH